MDRWVQVYDNVIDDLSCKELVQRFEDSHEYHQTVHQEEGDNVISFEQIILVEHEEWESVQNGMLEMFQDYIMHYKIDCSVYDKQWPDKYGYEAIRIKRYLANDYDRFDPHVDVLNLPTSKRFLAFFIYLNDVEEGGETEFYFNKPGTFIPYKVTPKRGRMVMFPPLWMYYHAGLKPVSGKKYMIHSYCHYAD
jgi:hypothetical protein|tara:strand:- start:453 stop:1031 length:579 start_codon:yes stop_codon:yes gene_type:complete